MMHKAWSSIEEVPYCIARSSVKFQGRTALKIIQFDPDWAFLDCNLSLNSPMGTKWCTKLEVAWKRCPIVLQGHPSNFTVTRSEKLTIWIQFEITRPVAAIKSLRFALFKYHQYWWKWRGRTIMVGNPLFSCDQAALLMVFSVCLSVRPSVCLSVRPSVTPFWLCSHHRIIMKFSGVITSDRSDVHAKVQGERSKVKVTEVTTQLNNKIV